jgi:protoheme ferro-lyase
MLEDIKSFLKKFIKNPIVIAAVAYIIYNILRKYVKSESISSMDSIKVIEKVGNKEVIYDIDSKMHALIEGTDILETSNSLIKIQQKN